MFDGIIVDGIEYPMVVSVSRTAKVTPSEVSGLMLNKHYYNDVIGTYFEYSVKMAVPVGEEDSYANLYQVLTSPVSEHTFILPYNQATITLTAKVESVKDEYVRQENRNALSGPVRIWRNISFSIIATVPSRLG